MSPEVSVSGTKVILSLSYPVHLHTDVITVAYSKPASNPLKTASGGEAATFSPQTVTNRVYPEGPAYVSSVIENVSPSVLEMTFSMTLVNTQHPPASAFSVNSKFSYPEMSPKLLSPVQKSYYLSPALSLMEM